MIEISKNLKLEKATPATAQNFWDNSSEGSFFTNPNFLKKFNEKIDYWLVKKGNEQLCLWPISTKKNFITLPIFSYYFGPFWSDYLEKKTSQHSRFSLSMQVYELFVDNFEKKYDITMGEGEEVLFGDLRLRLDDIYEKETPAKSIIGANIVLKKNNNLYNLTPEQNLYKYEGN